MLSMMLLPLVCRHPPISALPHYSYNHTYLIPIVPQKRKQLSIYRLLKEDHRNGLDGGVGSGVTSQSVDKLDGGPTLVGITRSPRKPFSGSGPAPEAANFSSWLTSPQLDKLPSLIRRRTKISHDKKAQLSQMNIYLGGFLHFQFPEERSKQKLPHRMFEHLILIEGTLAILAGAARRTIST